ncbi:MAG: alanine--tRNA ligase [Lachnospiraceae bacterium]|nr:alanine--tRNA ligase [Lachnospiraceae bacterium]
MRQFTSDELRKTWKEFYIKRGHVDVGAVSLVSDGSTGVLFNVAGMQPLMPYLLGEKHPLGTRLCNVQGCVRTNDIESVGDKSHVTFFEMMGSWSLGDYFKEERCKWSYELLTEVFGFDADHLAATVFAGDENAPRDEEGAGFRVASGFKKENIYYLPAEDNWWGLEYGPCGPDSEMFYIADVPDCGPNCGPGCSCGKYTELGNDVFMQYEKQKDGTLIPLKQKNVDTGWGLERNLAFLNGTKDVYRTDVFAPVIAFIEKASGYKYEEDEKLTRSMRILADHTRTSVMLIGDAAKLVPSNAGAGYVLRRLIRRAVRHSRVLGLKSSQILDIAGVFIDEIYKESFPLLTENRNFVIDELKKEIERFESTIENGMKEYKKILENAKAEGKKEIAGKDAFFLYDTFGFPLELTEELAVEEGFSVDGEGFQVSMEEQRLRAKSNAKDPKELKLSAGIFRELSDEIKTEFVGYDTLSSEDNIVAIGSGEALTDKIVKGEEATIVVTKTPFYATMGGQKGDIGVIKTADGIFEVTDTVKLPGDRVGHVGTCVEGFIANGSKAELAVDTKNRAYTCKNHSATHLLQKALQNVLGDNVHQQGSYQDPDRTRFDFSYGKAMTKEELDKVEKLVNEWIEADYPVITKVCNIEEAKELGAMALFGEKYGEKVRVVMMGDSKEFCGGTHVAHTGEIAFFKILSESGTAAGVRRIEAVTGANVMAYYKNLEEMFLNSCAVIKAQPADLSGKIEHMKDEIKALHSELDSIKSQVAKDAAGDIMDSVKEVNGVKLAAISVPNVDMNGLRDLGDQIKTKIGEGVIVLLSDKDGKVNMVAMATDEAQKKGAHAGNLIKAIAGKVGGGGGGRPNMAQAGGKNPAGISDAIEEAKSVLEGMITG